MLTLIVTATFDAGPDEGSHTDPLRETPKTTRNLGEMVGTRVVRGVEGEASQMERQRTATSRTARTVVLLAALIAAVLTTYVIAAYQAVQQGTNFGRPITEGFTATHVPCWRIHVHTRLGVTWVAGIPFRHPIGGDAGHELPIVDHRFALQTFAERRIPPTDTPVAVIVTKSGWPLSAVKVTAVYSYEPGDELVHWGYVDRTIHGGIGTKRRFGESWECHFFDYNEPIVPLVPIPVGFAINTLFFFVLWVGLLRSVGMTYQRLESRWWYRALWCVVCGVLGCLTAIAVAWCLAYVSADEYILESVESDENEVIGTMGPDSTVVTVGRALGEWHFRMVLDQGLYDYFSFYEVSEIPNLTDWIPRRWVAHTPSNEEATVIFVRETGWPFTALGYALESNWGISGSQEWFDVQSGICLDDIDTPIVMLPRCLPLRPVWIGLIGNVLIFAVLWHVVGACGLLALGLRSRFRLRRGCCPACAYDLRGDYNGGCPECGWNRPENEGEPL